MIRHVAAATAITALAALVATACSLLPTTAEAGRQPKACAVVYSVARCDAMTDIVAADLGKNRDDVAGVAIVPDAPPGGVHLSAGWHIRVRIALKDGTLHDKEICGGVIHEPACVDDPALEVRSPISGGYRDIPEDASPLPPLAASAVAAASPIIRDSISIPIERLGTYEITLGEGTVPNGIWTSASLAFAEPWPEDVALRDAIVNLDLHSLEPAAVPFDNMYVHGWRDGVERVRAIARFDVLWFRLGATLELRDVSVG